MLKHSRPHIHNPVHAFGKRATLATGATSMPMPPPAPMPPAGPPMPPKGAPPTTAGPPPPGDAPMSHDEIRSQVEGMLPDPAQQGYSYKKACHLADTTNKAIKAIAKAAGRDLPMESPEPPKPEKGDLMPGRFPIDTLIPALIVADTAASLGPDGEKYKVDVTALKDDNAIAVLAGQMDVLSKDRKILDIVKEASKAQKDVKGAVKDDEKAEGEEMGAEAYA